MAELFGKATGCSRGLGGSMHYFDKAHHMYGGHAIVGAHVPLAAGMAFAAKYRKEDRVTLCFFGDGAINQGSFHEALNLAGLFRLPVIFICENNFFAMGTSVKRSTSLEHMVDRAEGYDMRGEIVDGMNFREVRDKLSEIVASIRKDPHPAFVEVRTYRYRGHSMSDPASYRTKEELEKYRLDDPITRLRAQLTREGKLTNEQFDKMDKRAKEEAMASVKFAEESAEPPLEELYKYTYVERRRAACCRGGRGTAKTSRSQPSEKKAGRQTKNNGDTADTAAAHREEGVREITYRQALNEALAEEIERDPNVFLMGEEVAEYNGAYKVSQGLLDRFGPERIIDTPISENGFAGLGIGAAMVGLRPIIEFMTFSFSFVAFDQIVNNAPNMLTMSGGQFNIPITFRGPNGPAHQLGATHSHATECLYANVPGLKICTPATPRDAKGLLKTAVRDNNPVLVLECELFYSHKGHGRTGGSRVAHSVRRSGDQTGRERRYNHLLCADRADGAGRGGEIGERKDQRRSDRFAFDQAARSAGGFSVGRENASRRDCGTGSSVLRHRRGNRLPNSKGDFRRTRRADHARFAGRRADAVQRTPWKRPSSQAPRKSSLP